jgi:hypothetical protein
LGDGTFIQGFGFSNLWASVSISGSTDLIATPAPGGGIYFTNISPGAGSIWLDKEQLPTVIQ